MNFKEKMNAILIALGLVSKARANQLTPDDWAKIQTEFMSRYKIDLSAAVEEAKKARQLEEERNAALAIINASAPSAASAPTTEPSAEPAAEPSNSTRDPASEANLIEEVKKMTSLIGTQNMTIAELKSQISKMASAAAPDLPMNAVQQPLSAFGPGTTEKFLFGIENPVFSMDRRWNRIAVNRGYAAMHPVDEEKDGAAFRSAVSDYGRSLSARFAFLKAEGMLNPEKLASGEFSTNTSNLSNAKLGDQYVVIRQDRLIAHVLQRVDVRNIFPVHSNVQDRELMTNAFFSEISQAWQPGRVFKGDMKLEPEMGYVDDSMAKVFFPQMKELERLYIGYLNTNGSDPIKWSMIEWMLVNIFVQMMSEQNHRHMMGIFIKPTEGVPGHYLHAGTGIVYTLMRYVNENKLCPLVHPAYNSYTETTMLDAVIEFAKEVQTVLDVDQKISDYTIYLNDRHKPWWAACIRAKYHLDTDFSGVGGLMNNVPDTALSIQWVPNMDNLTFMFVQQPGNIELLENVPGEMLAMRMKDDMEAVLAWSVWKEGASASYVGAPFSNFKDLKANEFNLQRVFINWPALSLEENATTADGSKGFLFMIGQNTGPTALTDIEKARKGVAYILRCGEHTSNATTVAKSGKFANITGAFAPKKEGDYLMVVLNDEGTGFLELERCENEKRTINQKLQPNVPGGR